VSWLSLFGYSVVPVLVASSRTCVSPRRGAPGRIAALPRGRSGEGENWDAEAAHRREC